MRVKLTEIISTMDQYNGIGEYMDKYKGGEQLDIQTDIPNIPKTAKINEDMEKLITNLLKGYVQTTKGSKPSTPTNPLRRYTGQILRFDSFVNERYTPQPQHDEEQYTSQFYPEDDMLYKDDDEEE